ncbi:uncharacterized protein CCR75_007850 [Bremia lactucae]|uniref:CUE domain-containing protein n=1 Tax=Bremia lactucae TaxID=4779 RepID=A0A976FHG1_BRELC|nr:hypothetical protein CCR75_007973 [Bremia lactucae]TDH69082.1 hypothetical protein CCR75_009109 [Bremia lactucae]TDH69097.1 hypothetical protein CCR75_009240 [Bremia lactucae]TDH69101.1 hypothetical protein CCR75_009306 [Bremia lactucae]TDH72483.1 hypothetical protein CCR75_007850 [Bremia lactucae]
MSLESTISPLVASSDTELQCYLSDACAIEHLSILLDDFFTRGIALQTNLVGSQDVDVNATALSISGRAVFSLFSRLLDAPQLLQQAYESSLLHVTRLIPFCQLYGSKNQETIAELLEAVCDNVAEFPATLTVLQQLYIRQLNDLFKAVRQADVMDLIHRYYELSLSVGGMTTAESVLKILLLGKKELSKELREQSHSLLYRLVQFYEVVLPTLQRQLSSLDKKTASRVVLVIAEIRYILLLVLGRCVDFELDKPLQSGVCEGKVLAGFHTLISGCVDEDAEHGSYFSDLWFLCEYKDKVSAFFHRHELDQENLSYLALMIEQLPRRRFLPSLVIKESLAIEEVKSNSGFEEIERQAMDLTALVHQVKDLFPDLGEGYIELCLLSADSQVETVINFLLESNPPPVLIDVSHDVKPSDIEFKRVEALLKGNLLPAYENKKLDPNRVWVGKKAMETSYDPQIEVKDQQVANKTKELVAMYEEEDDYAYSSGTDRDGGFDSRGDGVAVLDEYDDDYNDEFDDFVPFSIRDGGLGDSQDVVREQNRRIRAKEEKDAFWEGMKNRNRESVSLKAEEMDYDEEKKESDNFRDRILRSPAAAESTQSSSNSKISNPRQKDKTHGEKKSYELLTPQQMQRQRAKKDKNKAKIANHNRKDRALKKMG